MNEQDRAELERLKERQAALQARLAEVEKLAGDLSLLSQKITQLEGRLQSQAVLPPAVQTAAASARLGAAIPAKDEAMSIRAPAPSAAPGPEPGLVQPPPIPPVLPQAPATPPPLTAAETATQPKSITEIPPLIPVPPPPAISEAPPPAEPASFEMRVGTYWLVRIGIVMLLTGLVFLANLAYKSWVPKLGPGGKVGLLYVGSVALLGVGFWLYRRQEKLKNYAQVLIAGGLAAVYFTTYAAHHFTNLRVIASGLLDGALLFAWAAFIVWLADRKKSELLALFALGLGYYTAVITRVGLFTLYSNLVLTIAAVFFLVRNRWAALSLVSLGATYAGYAFWRFYHGGEWRWATPSEGLWTGNYFLMSYWVAFTAGGFLSRQEAFTERKRAGFLSLNNGAFFALFILTMLQVRTGGFWKVCLSYGAVLLALAEAARRFLSEEKLARNAYLTQGLLLVTLGFITYFTGLKLALVLAAESVVLTILHRPLESRVLKVGSWVAAALAVGWGVLTMDRFDRVGLIAGAAVSAMMLFSAYWGRAGQPGSRERAFAETYFTVLALVMAAAATWQNTTDTWRGLVLALESSLFVVAGDLTRNKALRLGGYPFAAVAVLWSASELVDQFNSLPLAQRSGLWPALVVVALMIFNAAWEKQRLPQPEGRVISLSPAYFSILALGIALAATIVFAPREHLAPMLAAEALVCVGAFYALRLVELTLFGQLLLVIAQVNGLVHLQSNAPRLPWWNPVVVIVITVALSHWWQRQQSLILAKAGRQICQGVYAVAAVGLLFFWLKPFFSPATWLAMTSALALGITVYGVATRAWFLAACGQFFALVSVVEFVRQVWSQDGGVAAPAWYLALAPIALLALLTFGAGTWIRRHPAEQARFGSETTVLSRSYAAVALLMALGWVFEYVPVRERFWVLGLIGGLLFLAMAVKPGTPTLVASAAFGLTGMFVFVTQMGGPLSGYWPNLLTILFLRAQQQVARRLPERFKLAESIHTAMILIGGLALWLFISRWVTAASGRGHFYLTASWAGLALAIFSAGFALRERIDRWLGLGILMCALGRVVLFDIWKLETIYRILSFMALGVVLLVLGYIYNRYQEKIKAWL